MPERPGLTAIGTLQEPVPVTGFAANFSPIAWIAPSPLGSVIAGARTFVSPAASLGVFSSGMPPLSQPTSSPDASACHASARGIRPSNAYTTSINAATQGQVVNA